jgi:hypothetical protein
MMKPYTATINACAFSVLAAAQISARALAVADFQSNGATKFIKRPKGYREGVIATQQNYLSRRNPGMQARITLFFHIFQSGILDVLYVTKRCPTTSQAYTKSVQYEASR